MFWKMASISGWIVFKIEGWPFPTMVSLANYAGWAGNRALPVFNHDNPGGNT